MKCPKCGKEATMEGQYDELVGFDEDITWFCFDCGVMKRLFRRDPDAWVHASKKVFAVMVSDEVLEEKYAHYCDQWTWDKGDEETREWMDTLGDELKKRRTWDRQELTNRFMDTKVSIDDIRHEYRIYIEGKWV